MNDDNKAYIGCFGLFIVAGICGFLILFWTKTDTVKLASRSWHTELDIEDFQPRQLGGWEENVPSDAYAKNSYPKLHHFNSVYAGQTCTGTGTKRTCINQYTQIPVMKTWVDYTANRWAFLNTLKNNGIVTQSITIPEPSLECNGVDEIGCQRYGQSRTTLRAIFNRADGSSFECDYDKSTWGALQESNSYTMVFGVIRNEARCDLIDDKR